MLIGLVVCLRWYTHSKKDDFGMRRVLDTLMALAGRLSMPVTAEVFTLERASIPDPGAPGRHHGDRYLGELSLLIAFAVLAAIGTWTLVG